MSTVNPCSRSAARTCWATFRSSSASNTRMRLEAGSARDSTMQLMECETHNAAAASNLTRLLSSSGCVSGWKSVLFRASWQVIRKCIAGGVRWRRTVEREDSLENSPGIGATFESPGRHRLAGGAQTQGRHLEKGEYQRIDPAPVQLVW